MIGFDSSFGVTASRAVQNPPNSMGFFWKTVENQRFVFFGPLFLGAALFDRCFFLNRMSLLWESFLTEHPKKKS